MFMQAYTNQTYALLRIFTGLTFLWHGAQKLFAFPIPIPAAMAEQMPPFVVPIAGPIELIGGLLVVVGLFTRWAAFLCSGLMAAAYWMAHGTQTFFPLVNQGDLAIMYCFAFLFISAQGSGIWSVDEARGAA
jgi:putative oxidoreductase